MYICVYVYMCICIYVYMYICIHVYMYTCIYAYMYLCIYTHVYMYIYICIYVYIHMYICIYKKGLAYPDSFSSFFLLRSCSSKISLNSSFQKKKTNNVRSFVQARWGRDWRHLGYICGSCARGQLQSRPVGARLEAFRVYI
jgi:hypothetical protein